MPYYCPNEYCSNINRYNSSDNCPVCYMKLKRYDGVFAEPSANILNRKMIHIKENPPKKCECGNFMYKLNKKYKYDTYLFKDPAIKIPIYVCIKCMIIISEFPDNFIHIHKGRVTKGIDRSSGYFRVRIEDPLHLMGINTYQIPDYKGLTSDQKRDFYLHRGDEIVFALYQSELHGFVPIYYHNLTADIQGHFLGFEKEISWLLKTEPRDNVKKTDLFINGENPILTKAILELKNYQSKPNESKPLFEPIKTYPTDGGSFEMLIAKLLGAMGFTDINILGGAGDKGIDIEGFIQDPFGFKSRIIVQCKNYSITNIVKPSEVRDFAHVIEREKSNNASKGYFITSSTFSPSCYDKDNMGNSMILIDREKLDSLLKENGFTY